MIPCLNVYRSTVRGAAVAAALLVVGCMRSEPAPERHERIAVASPPAQTAPQAAQAAVPQRLAFDAAALPAAVRIPGPVVGGAHWRDGLGENYLVLAQSGARWSRAVDVGPRNSDADPL